MMNISAGQTIIYPSNTVEGKKGCGILPIGRKVKSIFTSGLRWNLGDYSTKTGVELDMASFVSTSNQITDESVTIVTSDHVIWCTALL